MKTTYWMQTLKPDGKYLKPVKVQTEKGRSNYANRMFQKYGDEVTVELYHFDWIYDKNNTIVDCKIITDAIYHA